MAAQRYAVPSARRPVLVSVSRSEIVGKRMEYQTQVGEAIADIDAAILYLHRDDEVPADLPRIHHALRLLREQRADLANLLATLKAECGELDGLCDANCREPGHGRAA